MIKMAFFDAKPYEIEAFRKWNSDGEIDIRYMEHKLNVQTVDSAKGCDVVCAFVNDTIDAEVLDELKALGVKLVAMRCAGYNNLDLKALGDLKAVRVPAYSPHAVAEHAMALLLTLNRKTHKAYKRTDRRRLVWQDCRRCGNRTDWPHVHRHLPRLRHESHCL